MPSRKQNKMHRVAPDGKADWERIDPAKWNNWQKVAAKTKGIVTIGDTITLAGTALVINGLYDLQNGNKAAGAAKIILGRLSDVGDGIAADKTGTKSPFGGALDVTADMFQLAFALPLLEQSGIMPWPLAVAVATPKIGNAVSTVVAKLRHKRIEATGEGKFGTGLTWGGIGTLAVHAVIGKHMPGVADTLLQYTGYGVTVAGIATGIPATADYAHVAFTDYEQPTLPFKEAA